MSPSRIRRSAAVAALALAVAGCTGDETKGTHEKGEMAPLPAPKAEEPAPPKDPPVKYEAPKEEPPPAPMPEPKAEAPKPPSMGDPPVPPAAPVQPDPAIAAHREFEDSVSARLKTVDGKITELTEKVKSASEDQREALQKALDDLSTKRDEAATKLDEIKTIAADKWDTAKAELDKSVGALESAAAEALK